MQLYTLYQYVYCEIYEIIIIIIIIIIISQPLATERVLSAMQPQPVHQLELEIGYTYQASINTERFNLGFNNEFHVDRLHVICTFSSALQKRKINISYCLLPAMNLKIQLSIGLAHQSRCSNRAITINCISFKSCKLQV